MVNRIRWPRSMRRQMSALYAEANDQWRRGLMARSEGLPPRPLLYPRDLAFSAALRWEGEKLWDMPPEVWALVLTEALRPAERAVAGAHGPLVSS